MATEVRGAMHQCKLDRKLEVKEKEEKAQREFKALPFPYKLYYPNLRRIVYLTRSEFDEMTATYRNMQQVNQH